eukprot:gene13013-biopygen1833
MSPAGPPGQPGRQCRPVGLGWQPMGQLAAIYRCSSFGGGFGQRWRGRRRRRQQPRPSTPITAGELTRLNSAGGAMFHKFFEVALRLQKINKFFEAYKFFEALRSPSKFLWVTLVSSSFSGC